MPYRDKNKQREAERKHYHQLPLEKQQKSYKIKKVFFQSPEGKQFLRDNRKRPQTRYNEYRARAKSRSISFELSFQDFMTFWNKDCFYCGNPIQGVGIDRKNNEEGYNLKNCSSCCCVCNRMKLHHSDKFFIAHMTKILNHLKGWDLQFNQKDIEDEKNLDPNSFKKK